MVVLKKFNFICKFYQISHIDTSNTFLYQFICFVFVDYTFVEKNIFEGIIIS